MPAVNEKQREAMTIAEHHPEKLYARNKGMKSMSHKQLHEFHRDLGFERQRVNGRGKLDEPGNS